MAAPRESERWQRLLYGQTYSARQSLVSARDMVGCVAQDRAGKHYNTPYVACAYHSAAMDRPSFRL